MLRGRDLKYVYTDHTWGLQEPKKLNSEHHTFYLSDEFSFQQRCESFTF